MLRTLQKISDIDQVVLSTHSPYFVDMINHDTIGVLREEPNATTITQTPALFSLQDKQFFKLVTEFDPNKNELFFGRKVIFVEGPGEQICASLVCQAARDAVGRKSS